MLVFTATCERSVALQRWAAGRAGRVDDEAAEGRAERCGETPDAGEDPESGGEELQPEQLHLAREKWGWWTLQISVALPAWRMSLLARRREKGRTRCRSR